MRTALIISSNKRIQIPDALWYRLAVYKVFWPPWTVVQLGSKRSLTLSDYDPCPAPEQMNLEMK